MFHKRVILLVHVDNFIQLEWYIETIIAKKKIYFNNTLVWNISNLLLSKKIYAGNL